MRSIYLTTAIVFILGILSGDNIPSTDILLFIFIYLVLLIVLKLCFHKKQLARKAYILIIFTFGVLSYNIANSEYLRPAYPFSDEYVTICGKISELPERNGSYNTYVVNVKAIISAADKSMVHKVSERVKISTEQDLEFGTPIIARGFLKPFSGKLNSGDFDFEKNNKAKNIYFHMTPDLISISQADYHNYSPEYFITSLKYKIISMIKKHYSGDDAAILCAVLTGYKGEFSKDLKTQLYNTNTMWLFYPSFMHISILITLIGSLKSFAGKRLRDILLIILLYSYAFFNFNSHHIIKSALLIAGIIISQRVKGYSNYMTVLSTLVFIMLIVNPLMIYETSFVISIASNVLIYYFFPFIDNYLKFIKNHSLRNIVSVWIIFSILMIPFQAYYFYCATPYSILLNFIYIPIMIFSMLHMPCEFIFTKLYTQKNYFSASTSLIISFVKKFPAIVEKLPFYIIPLKKPSIEILIIYISILFIIYKILRKELKELFLVTIAACMVIILSISSIASSALNIGKLRIDFVSLGQSEGAILSVPFHETIIIDGGGISGNSGYDYGEEIFLPYLKRNGFSKIDAAIVSHYHSDHCVGVIDAMEKLQVREVIIPDYDSENEYRKQIEDIAARKNIKLSVYSAGTSLKYPSGLEISIISPNKNDLKSDEENDLSFALKASYGNFSAIFTGDISENVEKSHLGTWGTCNVLKVAHHGSETSTSEEFILETRPENAIISIGLNNQYDLPKDEIIKRLESNNAAVYRTDLNGNIIVHAAKSGKYSLKSYR